LTRSSSDTGRPPYLGVGSIQCNGGSTPVGAPGPARAVQPPVERGERRERGGIGRREFLRLAALAGLAAALPGSALAAERRRKKKTTKVVYRLSTHARRCCKACKGHAANRFYRTRKAADKDRAHPGCNCAIVTQVIDRTLAKHYFKKRHKVFDLRSEVT
jgi:hypothetical protein